MTSARHPEITLDFNLAERDAWRRGELQTAWHAQNPGLFDENDLRLALSQPTGHHFEWKAAIHFFAAGYLSLIEKYELARSHSAKYEIFTGRLGPAARELIDDLVRGRGLPDLFSYRPLDRADWFFAEVKGPREPFGVNQLNAFEKITQRFGATRLKIVRCHACTHR